MQCYYLGHSIFSFLQRSQNSYAFPSSLIKIKYWEFKDHVIYFSFFNFTNEDSEISEVE